MAKGMFITFEGVEGSGKSTQARLLSASLRRAGRRALLTSEPGGTPLGRRIRKALLDPAGRVVPMAEWLLFEADRAAHVRQVILPALRRGITVVCDRYSDSSRAYQGFARGIGLARVDAVDRVATGGLKPGLTILLDMPAGEGLSRARRRGRMTRIDRERARFHGLVRAAFLSLARREPRRFAVIDAREPARAVAARIGALVECRRSRGSR